MRLHVPAKRYLCATDARYFLKLSAASVATLKLQGGPMPAASVALFETERFHKEAVRVRHGWNSQGKKIHYYLNFSGEVAEVPYPYGVGTELLSMRAVNTSNALKLNPWDLAIIEEQ